MARSLQTAKLVSSLVLDGVSAAIARRGFAAAAQAGSSSSSSIRTGGASGGAALKRAGKGKSAEKVSWGPDPKTGYYRPEGAVAEADVADLRAALLKHSH